MDTIFLLVKNLSSGGAEKQAVLLAKGLSDSYETHIVVWEGGAVYGRYVSMLQGSGVIIDHLYGNALSRFRAVVAMLRRFRPKAMFTYLTAANAIGALAARLTGIRMFSSLRSNTLPRAKLVSDRFVNNHMAEATVANSRSAAEIFASRGFKVDKIKVIHNGFEDISAYDRTEKPAGPVRLITVGRFVAEKDFDTMIRTFVEASRRIDGLRLDIVGYGPLEDDIRAAVEHHDVASKVDILIKPDNIPELLRRADIYICTSVNEGMSNSIMEALDADLPVVATDVGDNGELVADGVNGRLVPAGDIDALVSAVVSLASDKNMRRAMGAASKRRLAEKFSMDAFVSRYKQLIEAQL